MVKARKLLKLIKANNRDKGLWRRRPLVSHAHHSFKPAGICSRYAYRDGTLVDSRCSFCGKFLALNEGLIGLRFFSGQILAAHRTDCGMFVSQNFTDE